MSIYNELQTNSDKLETLVASSDFDISEFLLSDDDIIKKMLSLKNSGITKGQIDLMVDGVDKYTTDIEKKIKNIEEQTNLTPAQIAARKKDLSRRVSEDLGSSLDNISPVLRKIYPINKEGLVEQVSKMKSGIKSAVSTIAKEAKSLPKSLANASLLTVSGISGGAILSTTLPIPNLPGTISVLSMIIDIFLKIIDKIKNIISSLSPLKDLKYLISDDNLGQVAFILNSFLKIIIALFSPISLLADQINKVLEFLSSLFSNDNIEKNIRNVTKRLRKLNYLPRNNYSRVDAEDIDEVEQILDQYDVIDRNSRTNAVRMKDGIMESMKSQLDNFKNTVETSVSVPNSSDFAFEINDEFVYDVKLPNGTNLYGLSKDELDELKTYYDIKLNNI